ncbi:glycoside hydrolase family 38 [Horticoccus luteus]|uniref:Glycoside hydrolase family 38 n=1 Tax=Horticoccus luteus TaxID=2862869 RepID=A0A8F9TYQ4_9BACT|nr:alpha-mannosidase [Horticoccus luteus]QYM80314.1 glycoside hydrolase family 38 [Horticoccus luteus]
MTRLVFHVLPNAHLDPVWLWDQREGFNEGINTCRTVLNLMDEFPDLTFLRGEAAIYEHIRRNDPPTFARILRMIRAGRWDPVGATWIQPDTNLPDTEILCRHYDVGRRYFRQHLGVEPTAAWQADSFGHSAGLPDILAAAGMKYFAFFRPFPEQRPTKTPAFWWHGSGGGRVLAYRAPAGWYGCEREAGGTRLDELLAAAKDGPLTHVAAFLGLGNHGGGPSRRHVEDVHAWSQRHPEVEVRFSTLHRFFAALAGEVNATGAAIDQVHGELNFVQRGCFASVGRFKRAYRLAEQELIRTEITTAAVAAAGGSAAPALASAWESVLFNSFHDILPGSSIERAFDEQLDEVGGVRHAARTAAWQALNDLGRRIRVRLPAVDFDCPQAVPHLIWNPLPHPLATQVEVEASLDYRPLFSFLNKADPVPCEVRVNGRRVAAQEIATEHDVFHGLPWRKRFVVPLRLPAAGWNVVTIGYVPGAKPLSPATDVTTGEREIANHAFRLRATLGAAGVEVEHEGRPLFGTRGLHPVTVLDRWGSWGGMAEEAASIRLTLERGTWKITRAEVIEKGPLRACLMVRFETEGAHLDLALRLESNRAALLVDARTFSDLEAARVKLVLPGATTLTSEAPGGEATRSECGELPLLRWARARDGNHGFTLVSETLSACDLENGSLRLTLVRATRYACSDPHDQDPQWWRPAVDRGELRARFAILPLEANAPAEADRLTQSPIVTLLRENTEGELPASGSLAALSPAHGLRLLALKPGALKNTFELRVHNTRARATTASFTLAGRKHTLGRIAAGAIATFVLGRGRPRRISIGG